MSTSAKLGMPFISQQQATPEITHNEAILMMSAFQVGVESIGLNTPPLSPNEGDCYIIGTAPTGDWSGRANAIAIYFINGWRFVPDIDSDGAIIDMGAAQEGLRAWVKGDSQYYWNGSSWVAAASIPGEPMRFGDRGVTNNATTIAITAAADSSLATSSDYIQITGIFNTQPDGASYGVTQNTNSVTVSRSGYYRLEFWCSLKSTTNNTQVAIKAGVNGAVSSVSKRPKIYMRNAGEIHSGSAFGYVYLNANDVLSIHIASTTSATLTIEDAVFGVQSLTNGPTDIEQLIEYLSELADVEITSGLSDGQILSWDAANSVWKNIDNAVGGINDLDDVEIDSTLTDGQILVYNGSTQQWENKTISAAGSLSDLDDVEIDSTIATGQVLKWNGSAWVNAADDTGGASDTADLQTLFWHGV